MFFLLDDYIWTVIIHPQRIEANALGDNIILYNVTGNIDKF